MLFSTHPQDRELCPQTYFLSLLLEWSQVTHVHASIIMSRTSLSLLLEWSQVTHIHASIIMGGTYKPKKLAFYSTFARQLCDDIRLQGLFTFPAHSQTFKPTPASFRHTNSQQSHSTNCKCWRISSKFSPAT